MIGVRCEVGKVGEWEDGGGGGHSLRGEVDCKSYKGEELLDGMVRGRKDEDERTYDGIAPGRRRESLGMADVEEGVDRRNERADLFHRPWL